jgi:hypothetical protein
LFAAGQGEGKRKERVRAECEGGEEDG